MARLRLLAAGLVLATLATALGLVVAAVLLGRARPAALFAMLLVVAVLSGLAELATGGLVSPAPGRVERLRLDREKRVQRRLDAP